MPVKGSFQIYVQGVHVQGVPPRQTKQVVWKEVRGMRSRLQDCLLGAAGTSLNRHRECGLVLL